MFQKLTMLHFYGLPSIEELAAHCEFYLKRRNIISMVDYYMDWQNFI